MDNLEAHITLEAIDLCKDNGVTILTLHPHTSHVCQPLDRTCFGPFNTAYDKAVAAWMVRNPGKLVTIYDIAGLVNEAFPAITSENVLESHRNISIQPKCIQRQ